MLDYAAPPAAGATQVRDIALRQKWLNYAAGAYIVTVILLILVAQLHMVLLSLPLFGIAIVAAISAVVAMFMLSISLHGIAIGIVFGCLGFIPVINLLIIAHLSGKATKILRENGIKVGLLGAASGQIPDATAMTR